MFEIREGSIELFCPEISQGTVEFEGICLFFFFRVNDALGVTTTRLALRQMGA